ncbi:DUF1810 domain-containing protein [Microbulbifer sp. SAOS-129_SWC]|uniref:DUF1810 domain-containing protein n=1 Tax=Microbulbifer sp. SAOS-129_SWC TaxID=3145235 RepID=UPI003216264E
MDDPYNLERFVEAQRNVYATVRTELAAGRRQSDWMWFVFPQFSGQRDSLHAPRYAIQSLDEARAYLAHPLLGPRLRECCEQLLSFDDRNITDILGAPEDMRLRASMTLFIVADDGEEVFREVLDKFFRGRTDHRTLELLAPPR